jgi:hypothetical protein
MKKVGMFVMMLFMGIHMFASDNQQADEKQFAHIKFEKLVHDFGKIPVQGDASCEFVYTNTGNIPLLLTNVKTSCGCTAPEWTKEPVLPGEKGVIKVKYTTVHRPNPINKSITVLSNADNPSIILKITGEVVDVQ